MSQPIHIRPITSGPRYHWFGYYDKLQFDRHGRHVLGMDVDFEARRSAARRRHRDRPGRPGGRRPLDQAGRDAAPGAGSRAACCSGGPARTDEIMWNDREGDGFVCRILNVETGESRTLPMPVYTLSPDGRSAVTPDFRRINDMRPGYGYAGLPDPFADELAPAQGGIHRLDLETGEHELIVSLAEIAAIPYPHGDLSAAKHYFNHLLFNPDGSRFIFSAPLALRRRPVPHAHVHRRGGRQRRARGGRLRPHLALHLARPAAHPGLVVPVRHTGRRFYLYRGRDCGWRRAQRSWGPT